MGKSSITSNQEIFPARRVWSTSGGWILFFFGNYRRHDTKESHLLQEISNDNIYIFTIYYILCTIWWYLLINITNYKFNNYIPTLQPLRLGISRCWWSSSWPGASCAPLRRGLVDGRSNWSVPILEPKYL